MNERFFLLPEKKQQAIINAGYRVFSQNTYKRSPMSEIAEAAGISKSLLFHYFHNKKELYLFLWEKCEELTLEALEKNNCYGEGDFFERLRRGLAAKLDLMRKYQNLGVFSAKVFYETDPEVMPEIQKRISKYAHSNRGLEMDPEEFVPGLDLEMMYREMYLASEGYLWEALQSGVLDPDRVEAEFEKMIAFWKQIYLRK